MIRYFIASLLVSGCGPASDGGGHANKDLSPVVAVLESKIALPEGASALSSYDRFYSVESSRVLGVYVRSTTGVGRIREVPRSELPDIHDGGCNVINLEFDVQQQKFIRLFCNGVA